MDGRHDDQGSEGGRAVNVHALVVVGVNADGGREVLGLDVASGEQPGLTRPFYPARREYEMHRTFDDRCAAGSIGCGTLRGGQMPGLAVHSQRYSRAVGGGQHVDAVTQMLGEPQSSTAVVACRR